MLAYYIYRSPLLSPGTCPLKKKKSSDFRLDNMLSSGTAFQLYLPGDNDKMSKFP